MSTRRSLGLFSFFISELHHGYKLTNDPQRYKEKRRKVYAFFEVPRELEKFLFYGFLQCVDAFLYFFTLLPLRMLINVLKWPLIGWSPADKCDAIRLLVLLASTGALQLVDTSMMYHVVRGQAVIKLYIFYNMLEVADKLLSSFGQDILDALYWSATASSTSSRKYLGKLGLVLHLLLATGYTMAHTLLILFQATTLNVAFNSHNKALLTIMLSNNFVELKGSVFKKFAKSNLFQMACSDVRERFHYTVLLAFVVVRNLTAVNWAWEHLLEMIPDLIMVLLGEFFVDWFKHAFITKFNEIPYQVYKDFTVTIAYDVVRSRQAQAYSDHADQVSRRMGFVPLPLSVLVIRIVLQTVRVWDEKVAALLAATFICLFTLKFLNSIVLLGRACRYVSAYETMRRRMQKMALTRSKSAPATPPLSLLEFNDVMQQGTTVRGMTLSDVLNDSILHQKLSRSLSSLSHGTEQARVSVTETPIASNSQLTVNIVDAAASASMHRSVPSSPRHTSVGDTTPLLDNDASPPLAHSPKKRQKLESECESLAQVDRYTLLNDDRIES